MHVYITITFKEEEKEWGDVGEIEKIKGNRGK